MTRHPPGRRSLLFQALYATVLASAATWAASAATFEGAIVVAVAAWWLALPAVAALAAPPGEDAAAAGASLIAAATLLVGMHALLLAMLLVPALTWWLQKPSLPSTLAVATAVTLPVLLPWRYWPALALLFRDERATALVQTSPSARATRARRGARALSDTHDVFLGHGLPLLIGHVVLLGLPFATLLPIRPSTPVSATITVAALVLAWLVYRRAHLVTHRLVENHVQATQGTVAAKPPLSIPGNVLLRAAALRAALRDGDIEHALAIIEAGSEPTHPALPDEIDQRDALTIAATLNDSRPLRAMIAAGADVNHRLNGLTPLLAATRDSYYGRPETVLALLANGAHTDVRDENGWTPLHHAALSAEPAVAAILLDAGAAIDVPDGDGITALARACAAGNAAVAALLLDRGAARDAGALPPLVAAATAPDDDTAIIARLLRARASINSCDADGRTALHHAAGAGHVRTIEALIGAGADVDHGDANGRTPLHLACEQFDGNAPVIAALIAAGADTERRDRDGLSARDRQARRRPGATEPVHADEKHIDPQQLLAEGRQSALQAWLARADASQRAQLALAAAAQGMSRALADALSRPLPGDVRLPDGRLLVEAAIDDWPASRPLLSALSCAGVSVAGGAFVSRLLAREGGDDAALEAVASAWIDAGADPFAAAPGALPPLHAAVARGYDRLALRLLERGVDARSCGPDGVTPLHRAVRRDDAAVATLVPVLLRHGADPEAPSRSGETPLGIALDAGRTVLAGWLRWTGWPLPGRRLGGHDLVDAARAGDLEAVRRLLLLGLDPDARDGQGCTALIRAAGGGHRDLLEDLIQRGADTHARAHSGAGALAAATMAGHAEIVQRLLAAGASPDQRFAHGATALLIAAARGAHGVVAPLLASGADIAARDAAGNTALHAAAGYAFGCAQGPVARVMLLTLIAAGADIDAANGAGLTPLHVACGAAAATSAQPAGIDASLDVLLSRSQAVDLPDSGGCTPLHYAAAHGQAAAVRRLLARGAQASRRDHGGWRAEDYANRYGYAEVARLLRPEQDVPSLPLRPG